MIGAFAFLNCQNLSSAYFRGNAPTTDPSAFLNWPYYPNGWFYMLAGTLYHLPGRTGWSNTLAGATTATWLPTVQSDSNIGISANSFGFDIDWAAGQTIIVEASSNLDSPVWNALQTNTFLTDSMHFNDATWAQCPNRFYRICSP